MCRTQRLVIPKRTSILTGLLESFDAIRLVVMSKIFESFDKLALGVYFELFWVLVLRELRTEFYELVYGHERNLYKNV